jgi:hypothetical protein
VTLETADGISIWLFLTFESFIRSCSSLPRFRPVTRVFATATHPGSSFQEQIYEGPDTIVHEGVDLTTSDRVCVKVSRTSKSQTKRPFFQHFTILQLSRVSCPQRVNPLDHLEQKGSLKEWIARTMAKALLDALSLFTLRRSATG